MLSQCSAFPLMYLGKELPALARHFLPRSLSFLIDGDMPGTLSHYAEGKEPRYFKGPYRPVLGDLAYTEKVLVG